MADSNFDPSDYEAATTPTQSAAATPSSDYGPATSGFDASQYVPVDPTINAPQPPGPSPIPGWQPGEDPLGNTHPIEPLNGGFLHNTIAAADNSIGDLAYYGLPQMYHNFLAPFLGIDTPQDAQKAQLIEQATAQRQQQEANMSNASGATMGNVIGRSLPALALPGGFLEQIAGQAGLSSLYPTAPGQTRSGNALATTEGMLTSPWTYAGLGLKLGAQPFYSGASSDVSALRAAGIPLDTAQATGSRFAGSLKRWLVDNPIFGNSNFEGTQQIPAQTKAVLSNLGSSATDASPANMDKLNSQLGQTISRVYGRNPIDLMDQTPLTNPQTLFKGSTVPQPNIPLGSGVAIKLNSAANPTAPMSLSSGLDILWKRATDEFGDVNNPLNRIISNIRTTARSNGGVIPTNVMDAMRKSISNLYNEGPIMKNLGDRAAELFDTALGKQETFPGDTQQMLQAKQAFGALQPVVQSVAKGIRQGVPNEVTLPRLHQALTSASGTSAQVFGSANPAKQDLMDLAGAGSRVLPEKVGNSGSAMRALAPLLGAGAIEGLGNALHGDPTRLAAIAGVTGALPLYSRYALYGALPRATANSGFVNSLIGAANKASIASSAGNNNNNGN